MQVENNSDNMALALQTQQSSPNPTAEQLAILEELKNLKSTGVDRAENDPTAKSADSVPTKTTSKPYESLLSEQNNDIVDSWIEKGVEGERTVNEILYNQFMKYATDPEAAAKHAKEVAGSWPLVAIPTEVFEAAVKSGDFSKITNGYPFNSPNNPSEILRQERMAYHDKLVEEGVPPLEILMEMYQFNIDQPMEYNDFLDVSDSHPPGYWRSTQQEQLDRLINAITIVNEHRPTEVEEIDS